MTKRNIYKGSLLIGVSILSLTIGSNLASAQCVGTRSVDCLDHQGNVILPSNPNYGIFCSNAGAYSSIMGPMPTSTCATTCPPPPPPYRSTRSGGGGGGSSRGGGYVDTDGDGIGDTRADRAPVGDWASSNTMGGRATGTTSINSSGWISGTHTDGIDGRTRDGSRSSGSSFSRAVSGAISSIGRAISRAFGGGGGSRSSDSDRSRVICTYFFVNKEISQDYYYADYEYTLSKIHPNTVRGYHFWAVPYVEKMYKNPGGLLTKIIRPVAIHRARELAYQMGVSNKPDYLGKFFRILIEPACFILGTFVKQKDYSKLYTKEYLEYAAKKYQQYRLARKEEKQYLPGFPTLTVRV